MTPSGYACGVKIAFEQEDLVLCSISHFTIKHTLSNLSTVATYEHIGFRVYCTLLGCMCPQPY